MPGDGAVARDRGRLRHARRPRLVRALRRGPARRARRRGDRHPRRPERARSCASATTASSPACAASSTPCASGARAARASSSSSSTSSRSGGGRSRATYFARFLAITDDHRAPPGRGARRRAAGATAAERRGARAPRRRRARRWRGRARRRASSRRSTTATASASPTSHLPHIRELPRVLPGLFADAARRAREAGFDGVELHYAHAYTMASFLSRLNTRDDGYGGAREQRVRLPLEVLARGARARRRRLRGRLPLPRRRRDRGRQRRRRRGLVRRRASPRAGVDFLSLSKGGKFEDAKQPKVGEAAYPVHRRVGLRVHADRASPTRAARSGATCRWPPPIRRGRPRGRASRRPSSRRRHRDLRAGRGHPRARRGRHRRGRAPDARRPRLVPEDPARPRRTWSAAASSRTTARGSTSSTSR